MDARGLKNLAQVDVEPSKDAVLQGFGRGRVSPVDAQVDPGTEDKTGPPSKGPRHGAGLIGLPPAAPRFCKDVQFELERRFVGSSVADQRLPELERTHRLVRRAHAPMGRREATSSDRSCAPAEVAGAPTPQRARPKKRIKPDAVGDDRALGDGSVLAHQRADAGEAGQGEQTGRAAQGDQVVAASRVPKRRSRVS